MPGQKQDNDNPKTTKRNKKRIWLVAVIVILTALLAYHLLTRQAIDERLAEIEAARAIPDSENAAVIYHQLLQDPNAESILKNRPEFLESCFSQVCGGPWQSTDYPQVAGWLEENRYIIATLLDAADFKKCRFQLAITFDQELSLTDRLSAMRRWAYLLSIAAGNDTAEGRTDEAINKCRCLLQMSEHLRQQPQLLEHLVAFSAEAFFLKQTAWLILRDTTDETLLQKIEELPLYRKHAWADFLEEVLPVEEVVQRKWAEDMRFLDRVKYELGIGWLGNMKDRNIEGIHDFCRRSLAAGRATHVLIALRRYKNKHGRWPDTLDEIKSLAPPEVFVDPISGDSFVYKLADDTFRLYSKGQNNIDEDGRYVSEHVPNTLQVRIKQDDILFWPPRGRQQQSERQSADIEDPNKPAEPTQ